jgi:hypothetical protein
MKKIHYLSLVLLVALSGCAKFTDVDPKGKNLLGTVTQLDQVLDHEFFGLDVSGTASFIMLINDGGYPRNMPNLINSPVKTLESVLLTWDEQADRAALTSSDGMYAYCYSIIGKVANPVLLMADAASGDRDMANRLKAEAYVLRAYFHYLAVNFFAKAYNPATAATDGGVPYVKEHDLLTVPSAKYTVQEVYDFILEDLQAAFDLNSLPDKPINPCRVGKAFAHAVQAKVLVSMHRFDDAKTAAGNSLAIQNAVEDHRDNIVVIDTDPDTGEPVKTDFSRPLIQSPEDLFYSDGSFGLYITLSPELSEAFEPGHIFYNSVAKRNEDVELYYGLPGIDLLSTRVAYLNSIGLSTVDMLLTLAECKIRSGEVDDAMEILNDLRAKRVDPYTPVTVANAAEAFAVLKNIARTETWYGIKHFISLKRWNTEEAYKETIRKTLLGVDYELRPDSPLWVFPFPRNATGYNPNLTQNYE